MPLLPGLTATVTVDVTEGDTALAYGSGDVPVLATPRVIALMEEAAVSAVRPAVPAGQTTVGVSVAVDHVRAIRVGGSVEVVATVTAVEGRRIEFEVAALEGEAVVARGTHTRVVVDRDRFAG